MKDENYLQAIKKRQGNLSRPVQNLKLRRKFAQLNVARNAIPS